MSPLACLLSALIAVAVGCVIAVCFGLAATQDDPERDWRE